jgi:hypothetical protein
MPFFPLPLEKTETIPKIEDTCVRESKRTLDERNRMITMTIYREVIIILNQIFLFFFVLDVFPIYVAMAENDNEKWGKVSFR